MEVSNLAAFDEHICVYCRIKINGLNNYIEHLKACEPFETLDTKLIPRLPFLRTPSRESLQSELQLASLAESRCSSPDSYMQRIYDDMYRYEKEVLDDNSVAEASYREESKNDGICKENGDKGLMSMRWPATPCQTVMCAESPGTDGNYQEGLEEKLKELSMGLDSQISGETAANSVDGVTEKCEENVLNESRASTSLAFSEKIAPDPEEVNGGKCRERASRKCAAAQYLLGIIPPDEMLGNSCGCGLGCLENRFIEPRPDVNKRCLVENVAPSAGLDTGSIDQIPKPTQNIPVSSKCEKVDPRNSSHSSGYTNYCDGGVTVYKVWGDTAELLAASFKDCMLGIFCSLTSMDKKKVMDEVDRLCFCYTSSGGKIQIKIIQAVNKMNLLIKKIEDAEKGDSVELGGMAAEGSTAEKKNGSSKAVLKATSDKEDFPKMIANLSESSVQRPCGRNTPLKRIFGDESVHKRGEETIARKENVQTAAIVSPVYRSVCEKDHFKKSAVDSTISMKVSEENVLETRNITPKLDPKCAISKERTLGNLVARSPKNNAVKEVCDDRGSHGNGEVTLPVLNPHISSNFFPNSVGACALKCATDAVFEKVQNASKFGTFFDAADDRFKISKDNIMADCTSNEDIMLAESISSTTIVSQKNGMHATGTIVGGSERGDACQLKNSQHKLSSPSQKKLLKSPMAPSPWCELSDTLFFSSVEDIGLEVEVGPNETGSFVAEDIPMKEISSLLIPMQFMQEKASAAARGSCLTRKYRRGSSRGRKVWGKVQRVRERNEESSGELLFQEGNNSRSKRGRHAHNVYRNRICSRKTLCNREEANTRMCSQRYHLRTKSIEGCATVTSSQMVGKKSVDAPMVKESQGSGVKHPQSRLLDEVRQSKRECSRKRGRKRVIESMLVAEEHTHAESVLHSKETRNKEDDMPISISDATAHSKCVKDQVSTVSNLDFLTNKDTESVSGLKGFRGFNLPLQKNSFCETRKYSVKRHNKLKLLLVQRKMQVRKTRKVTMRGTTESPMSSSELINTQIGYSLRNRVLQPVNAKTLPASVPESSEEDVEQKRPNASCPAIPVFDNPIQPIRRGRQKRKRSNAVAVSEATNGSDAEWEEQTDGDIAKGPQKPLRKKMCGKKLKFTSIKRNTRAAVKEGGINLRDTAGSHEAQIPSSASKETKPNRSLSNTGLQPTNVKASLRLNSQILEEAVNDQPKMLEAPITARKLDKNQEATSCPVLHFYAKDAVRLQQKRNWEKAERDAVNISESAVCMQVEDGNECRTQNLDQITASSEMADEVIDSLGHVSSIATSSSLYNELVEMKSLRNSVIFKYPVIEQNNAEDTSSMDMRCARTEQLPTVQGRGKDRSKLKILSVKLNQNDKEGLELIKTLKPLSIDLGFKCDSKEFLSKLCATQGKDFAAAAINVKQDKGSRTSLSRAENGKGSPRSKISTEFPSLVDNESERRTKMNGLERSTSQNLWMEEMPVLIPEISVMQEVRDLKISNYNVKKASQVPRLENKVIDVGGEDRRKPIQVLSKLIDDDEVQIVLELVKPEKKVSLHQIQAHIDRLKGWRKAESIKEEFVAESFSSSPPSSHNEPNHVIRRNEEVFERMTSPDKNARLSSTCSVLNSGMEKLDESVPDTGLSNIVVTNVRSGAELTEEERDIPLSLENDEWKEIRGQAYDELREIPAGGETEMKTTLVGCKKDDLNGLFRKRVLVNAPYVDESCMSGGGVTESLQENVMHPEVYNNLDTFLPDVVQVSHANFSHGNTMPKKKESNLGKFFSTFNKDGILPKLPGYGVGSLQYDQGNGGSIQMKKYIPIVTFSPLTERGANVTQTTKLPKTLISQNNQSKTAVYHSNKNETIKQMMFDCKSHEVEGKYTSEVNPALSHLTCNDSEDSILCRKTIPSVKKSRAGLNPAAQCCRLEQEADHSGCFRTPCTENNSDAKPQNLTSASQETSNDLYQGSLEVYHPVTETVPPNFPSKVKASAGFVPSDVQNLIVSRSHDQFLRRQKLGHNTCTPSQEVSLTGTLNPGTSGCSVDLAKHELIKLGEIMSNDEEIVKEELNTLAKSLGMKLLLTQPGGDQLGKFIFYNIEEKKPESNIIRVDYCKSSQMKQKS